MARVKLGGWESRYAHFGLYNTSVGGDEPIIVRRKAGIPPDYQHGSSRKVQRQRDNFALASQHWANLTPTQKGYYRYQMAYVDVIGSPSKDKLLRGRQLFIAREIRELLVAQKQLITPFEVCIILCDEALNPLHGEMWLYWQETEEAEPEELAGDELVRGNFLFRNVKPGQFVYHPYGESEGYYDPEGAETWLTQDELRKYHYHILKDSYRELVLLEKWSVSELPELELVLGEGWSLLQPPELELVMLEEWTKIPFPELELVMLEEWDTPQLPPELELVIEELWPLEPPELELVVEELWQVDESQPEFEQVISEPWTGTTFVVQLSPQYPSYRDGYVFRETGTAGLPWGDIHDGAGTGSQDAAYSIVWAAIAAVSTLNKWRRIRRGLAAFPTETLPDNALILSAKLKIWGSAKLNTLGGSPAIAVYRTNGVNPADLVNADYGKFESVIASNAISYAAFNDNGYNTFVLNAIGLAHINKSAPSVFGFREATYDAPNNPPTWVSGGGHTFQGYGHLYGAGYKEILEITYVIL